MMPDNPSVGKVLHDLTWQSIREMNAARRYHEEIKPRRRNTCEDKCPPDLITRKQAAELLNVNITTIKFWAWKGKIPSVRVKGKRFYDPEAISKAHSMIDRKRGPKG